MSKQKAVVYARVSTDKEEQKMSLESQMEYYPQYVQDKGMQFLKLYYDEGLSGTSSYRKDFIQMLYDAGLDAERVDGNRVNFRVNYDREPKFDWIIVKDDSRLARNVNAVDIVRMLRDKNVYIEFETLGFTSQDIDWELRLGMFLTFSQEESITKSRKLRDAYIKRSKKGKFHMSVNLLGYARNKETKEYYIKEDEAKIVRKIFDYYVNDRIGSYEIGDILNQQGYKTIRGRNWTGSAVLRVLRNEKYKGQVILNRYGKTDLTGSNKRVINPVSEWIVHDNAIPKIVSVEQFDKAQAIMEKRTTSTVKNKGSNKRQVRGKKAVKNVFYKKIYCGKCGADYIRESASKIRNGEKIREYFYGCRNRRNTQRNHEKCMNKGISHDVLVRELNKIGKNINLIDFDDKAIMKEEIALNKKLNEIDDMIKNSEAEKSKIDDKIHEIDVQINNLFNTLSDSVSDTIVKLTQQKIEEHENNKKSLIATKANFDILALKNEKQKYNDKFDEIVKLSKKVSYTFDEMLNQIHEIEILDDKKVVVKFTVPTLVTDGKRLVTYMFTR